MQRDDRQMTASRRPVAEQDGNLFWQAVLDVLHAQQAKENEMCRGRPTRSEMYQNADSPKVCQLCEEYRDDVDLYLWLQWLAYSQFAACWGISQGYEMPIGLYRDPAAGAAEGGAETWCDRELYCLKASVGTPSDILGPLRQSRGLPPMDSHIITVRTHEPLIELLRTGMQNCSVLRIDYVMLMLCLWWIPYGGTADQGACVHYPVDDLLLVPTLKNKRHRCTAIGENLGTVLVEIVGKLCSSGVYPYKVLYSESDHEKILRVPKVCLKQSMTAAVIHNLSMLRGYWESGGLTLGKILGPYPDEMASHGPYQNRKLAKQGLLDTLHKYGYLSKRAGHKASLISVTPTPDRGSQRYVADSNSTLLGLQPEDWLDMADSVNIPGTSYQYRNQ